MFLNPLFQLYFYIFLNRTVSDALNNSNIDWWGCINYNKLL